METYSERIRADPPNKYVHIRDIVSELKAYKAKPMKHVITSAHNMGLNSDYSSDSSIPTKRAKLELEDVKQELPCKKQESMHSCVSGASCLPPLLRSSSTLCKFVPLSAMSGSTESADVDVGECRLIDVLADDTDSRSSVDDFNMSQSVTTVNVDEVANNGMKLALNSDNNSSVSASMEFLDPAKSSVELSANAVKQSSKREQRRMADEVKELSLQTVNDGSEPTAHSSKQCDEHTPDGSEVKSKLPSARHIRYLETLLSV